MKVLVAGLLTLALSLPVACSQAPMTGRSQLILVSDAEMSRLTRQSRDRWLTGVSRQNGILKETESEQASKIIPSVTRVAMAIIGAAGMTERANWRVFVVKTSQINANVTPDGTIVV